MIDFTKKPSPRDIEVMEGNRWLAPGTYVEWLERFGAPITQLGWHTVLVVRIESLNRFEDVYHFSLMGDDCVVACYEYNTRTRRLVCTSPFIDDNDDWDISRDEFNTRLGEFCKKYNLTPKFR